MQFHKLFGCVVLSAITFMAGAMDHELNGGELPELMSQGLSDVRDAILRHLDFRDLSNLDAVSRSMRRSVRQVSPDVIDEIMTKKAILLSNVSSACSLDLGSQRYHFATNEEFENYVLEEIRRFARANPGRWINLKLHLNRLGENLYFFSSLMRDIVKEVHALNIDIAEMMLVVNGLKALPDNIFDGFQNLHALNLGGNELTALKEDIFAKLTNVETIILGLNRLTRLPENIFSGLTKLKYLDLSENPFITLSEKLFAGLINLRVLRLSNIRFIYALPVNIFAGLRNTEINFLRTLFPPSQVRWTLPEGVRISYR